MKVAIVDIRDILDPEKNPDLCLSPLRYTGDCIRCQRFKRALQNNNYDVDLTIKTLRCKPQVSKEAIKLFEKKKELLKELREINKEIEEINKKIGVW